MYLITATLPHVLNSYEIFNHERHEGDPVSLSVLLSHGPRGNLINTFDFLLLYCASAIDSDNLPGDVVGAGYQKGDCFRNIIRISWALQGDA